MWVFFSHISLIVYQWKVCLKISEINILCLERHHVKDENEADQSKEWLIIHKQQKIKRIGNLLAGLY